MRLVFQTNRRWREFSYRNDVPARVLDRDFAYQDPDEALDGFFLYRGVWYHLDQFERAPNELASRGYTGFHGDSFFSGVAIKLSSDGERYQVATVICVG